MSLPRLLHGLVSALPAQAGPLLLEARFAAGRAALERLAEPAWREAAVRGLAPAEAEWLEGEIRGRWARVGVVTLAPHVELALAEGGGTVEVLVEGVEEPIRVAWEGAREVGPLSAAVEEGAARVLARVDGRVAGQRVLLLAELVLPGRTG
jgi:hypothetical protein